jgi:hypothetical protein
MTNYSILDDKTKEDLKKEINTCAESFGGKSHFLQLIEAIRLERPHPLMAKNSSFKFKHGMIKWEKVIFRDKVLLLLDLIRNSESNGNLMPEKESKRYKTIMNLLRTLAPMEFQIRPKNNNDGEGFILKPFDVVNKTTSHLNFMFEAVFFLPTYIVKQVFNGSVKSRRKD